MQGKIGIIGIGIENLHIVNFLIKNKINDITVLDKRNKEQIGDRYNSLENQGVKFQLGKNYLKNLSQFDILFRSPGFPLFSIEIAGTKRKGATIYSAMKLFFDLCPCPIIGITGTKGKGATSSLIYEILKIGGRDAFLGGNIGIAPFEFFDKINKNSIVVLKLSSFQLEDLHKSSHISIVTNMSEEHLSPGDKNNSNYHKSTQSYISAKKTLLNFRTDLNLPRKSMG